MTILLYDLVGEDTSRPFSPHCWKTAMSVAHKGLEFRRMPTPFTSVPAVEGGVSKTVPVIRDGDEIVADSFTIALYLDEAYPDRPTLFGGEGGKAMARFIERWSQLTLHPYLGASVLTDIHARLAPPVRILENFAGFLLTISSSCCTFDNRSEAGCPRRGRA